MNTWIFDVDGVLTDIEKRQTDLQLIDELINKLQHQEIVALNTGRSKYWAIKEVIQILENRLVEKQLDKKILSNFFAVQEKGATWLNYTEKNTRQEFSDPTISVPEDLKQKATPIFKQFKQHMTLEKKQTMISAEMNPGTNIADFRHSQEVLKPLLQKLLDENNYNQDFKLDLTNIGVDIENKHVGKALGAERIITWLQANNQHPDHFYTFGDSTSDIAMAQKFARIYGANKVTFIFVGDKLNHPQKEPFQIILSPGFHLGTLQFLNNVNHITKKTLE